MPIVLDCSNPPPSGRTQLGNPDFRANVTNQKRKNDVQLMVSTLMMDYSILSLFSALRNSATGETEKEISLVCCKV